jgi:hypothetical protein
MYAVFRPLAYVKYVELLLLQVDPPAVLESTAQ